MSKGEERVKVNTSLSGFIRPTLVWLALFLGTNGFLFGQGLMRALNVLKNHKTIMGTITDLPPRKPAVATYEVNGRRYIADTSCAECLGISTFDRLRIGDEVRVEYNPATPEYGIAGSAKALFLSNVKDIAFIGVFLVFATAYFEFNIRKYVRKSSGQMSAQPSA